MNARWIAFPLMTVLLATGCKSGEKKQELPDSYFANRGVTRDSPEGRALAADPDPYWERNLRAKEQNKKVAVAAVGLAAIGTAVALSDHDSSDDDDKKKSDSKKPSTREPDLHPSRRKK